MASIRRRTRKDGTTSYTVVWREGGGYGPYKAETVTDEHSAELLRDYLNANGQSYTMASEAFRQSRAHGPTLADIVAVHLSGLTGVTVRTKADYARDARTHIVPHLGHIRAGQITRAHVKAWVNQLAAAGVAPKSIANYHGLLASVMNTAIETGARADNPCKGVRLPKRDRRGDRAKFLEPAEYRVLLAQVPDYWKPLVGLLAGTGLRWGEATALTVADVILDGKRRYIIVDKAWKRDAHNGFYVDRPKTTRANREVTIDKGLARTLVPLMEGRAPADYLFTLPDGRPVMHRTFFRDVWKPAAAAAMELREDNPHPLRTRPQIHGLRHSHGSWLAEEGVDLTTIQRRLGHESITTTVNTYGHVSARSEKGAAEALERALRGKKRKG
jgi:integrase